MDSSKVVVSVCMLTYNQEDYIKLAIEGVLMQKCNFQIELIIGEDCSTDNTRKICIDYQQKYPEIIKLFLPETNIGATKNAFEVLSRCSGKYIAICEGDDYWTDPNKLQTQVDFMEANPDYSLVYHKVNELWQESGEIKSEGFNTSNEEITYTISDLAKGNFIHTPSVLFRNKGIDFTKIQLLSTVADYYMWMICAKNGKIKYLPQIMAVYRVSNNSTWALKSETFRIGKWMIMLAQLLGEFADHTEIYSDIFLQIRKYFTSMYDRIKSTDYSDHKLLDRTTKELLILSPDFQMWWFLYMLHIKTSRLYRLKYYLYLLRKNALVSPVSLLKKCIY